MVRVYCLAFMSALFSTFLREMELNDKTPQTQFASTTLPTGMLHLHYFSTSLFYGNVAGFKLKFRIT